MTALLVWKLVAALATTPSAVIVARAIARRFSSVWKAKVSETDYLRAEVKREREEKQQTLRDVKAEYEEKFSEQAAEIERLRYLVDARGNENEGLQAALKETRHDLATARLFVDGAIATRRDKRGSST